MLFEAAGMNDSLGPLKGYRMIIAGIGESVNGLAHLVGVRGNQTAQDGSRVSILNHASTWFSQEAWVGV